MTCLVQGSCVLIGLFWWGSTWIGSPCFSPPAPPPLLWNWNIPCLASSLHFCIFRLVAFALALTVSKSAIHFPLIKVNAPCHLESFSIRLCLNCGFRRTWSELLDQDVISFLVALNTSLFQLEITVRHLLKICALLLIWGYSREWKRGLYITFANKEKC